MPLFEITTIDDISSTQNDIDQQHPSEEKRRWHSAKQTPGPYRLFQPQTASSNRDNVGKKSDSDLPVARTDDRNRAKQEADDNKTEAVSVRRHPPAASVIAADCLRKGYKIGKTIGSGAYAKVKLAEILPYKLATSERLCSLAEQNGTTNVAIKITEVKQVPKEFVRKFLPRELDNHLPLQPHDNVVRVYDHFRTRERLYVVMEYCSKGDLLDLLNDTTTQQRRGLSEDVARGYFKQLLLGLKHVHDQGVVHRDIKCENILVDSSNCIKLADFGFCTRFHPDDAKLLKTTCGSWAYTAPEIARKFPYDGRQTDIWSLGIVLFTVTNGRLPFKSTHIKTLAEGRMGTLNFQQQLSVELMTLVRRILRMNPANRPSMDQILNDPWITGKQPEPNKLQHLKLQHHNLQQHNLQHQKWNLLYTQKKQAEKHGSVLVNKSSSRPPLLYRRSTNMRGSDATVTVNHEKNETVILKSRTKNSKNIWTTGPTVKPQTRNDPMAEGENYNSVTVSDQDSCDPRDIAESNRNHPVITVDIILQQSARNRELVGNMGRRDISNNKVSKWLKDSNKYSRRVPLQQAPLIEADDKYQSEVSGGYGGCKVKVRVSAPALTHKTVDMSGGESESQMYFHDDLSSAYDSALPHSIQNPGELATGEKSNFNNSPSSTIKHHQNEESAAMQQPNVIKSSGATIKHTQNGESAAMKQRAKPPPSPTIKYQHNLSTVGLKPPNVKIVSPETASPPLFRKSVWTVPDSHEMTSVRELVRLADIVKANGQHSDVRSGRAQLDIYKRVQLAKKSLPFVTPRSATSERHVSSPTHHVTRAPAQSATCTQKQPISAWRSRRAASVNTKKFKRRNGAALRQK